MPKIDLSMLNQRQTPAFYADVLANRPAAGFIGRIFVSTNTYAFYRDNGTGWDLIGGPGTGTVTGSGAANQVAFWSGASLITGENNLWWDDVNNHFGINTNTPGTAADIHHNQSTIVQLNQTTATNDTRIAFQNSGVSKWRIGSFYNGGSNDYAVNDAVLNINRLTIKSSSGQTFVGDVVTSSGLFVVNNSSSDAHIVALGASAPSIRVRNAGTGASLQFGLGLATTTNNFIQGATGGEFCIFNDSLTAQPILFGIKDAGLGNTQEAARISASRNFLIGTTTDAGQKLQVSGNTKINAINAGIELYQSSLGSATYYVMDNTVETGGKRYRFGYTGASPDKGSFTLYNQTDNITPLTIRSSGAATFSNDFGNSMVTLSGIYPNITFATNGNFVTTGSNPIAYRPNDIEAARFTGIGNLLIGTTTDAGQKLQVNGSANISGTVIGSNFITASGSVANPYNVWTTMFTVQTGVIAMYQLIAVSQGNGLTYTSTALVVSNNDGVGLYNYTNGGALQLRASGYDIQCNNGSGSELVISFKYIKLS